MAGTWKFGSLALIVITPLAYSALASSATPGPWTVQGKLHGKPKDGGQVATDISGLACAPIAGATRLCLIIDDESQGTQLVILNMGRLLAGDTIRLSNDMLGSKPLELDAEGVAYADGFFYVVGSHGRPRHEEGKPEAEIKAKTLATRHLYRVDLSNADIDLKTGAMKASPAVLESASLDPYIKADHRLANADLPLNKNGLTIEGLAVRDKILTLGFRGPSASGASIVLGIPLSALFQAKPGQGASMTLPLGTDTSGKARGIRDLSVAGGGFVGIAGPVTDPADESYSIRRGDYALFWWDGRSAPVLRDLDGYDVQAKPEAIMPLRMDGHKLSVLLLFDGPLNGMPTAVDVSFSPALKLSRPHPRRRIR
jgi:Protein of unknown function (DUF3616)